MSEAERREHVRQRVSRVEVRVASREALQASYLRDLSLGGLFVRSKQPLPTATEVVIELTVAGGSPTRLRGVVVRHEHGDDGAPRGFGVQFSTVDAETRAALELLLAEHQTPEPPSGADEMELAELRGTLEAYEESLALLRESEMQLAQRLESTEAERGVLEHVAGELQARVAELETDREGLKQVVDRLAQEGSALERVKSETAKLRAELEAQRRESLHSGLELEAVKDDAERLRSELAEAQTAQQELEALRSQLAEAKAAQAELSALKSELASARSAEAQATRLGDELNALKVSTAKVRAELNAARTSEAELKRLAAELEIQRAGSLETQAQLKEEISALQAMVEDSETGALRRELQDLSAQLDDERLKSMALERALQRFSQMGGVVPPRG